MPPKFPLVIVVEVVTKIFFCCVTATVTAMVWLPLPWFPAKSSMDDIAMVRVMDCPAAQTAVEKDTVIDAVPLPVTEETVGGVLQVLAVTLKSEATTWTASEKVRAILPGIARTPDPFDVLELDSVGGVLSTVMTKLSGETVEGFPRLSCTVPAFT